MKTEFRASRRSAPHPLVTLIAALLAGALILISLKTSLLSRSAVILIAICFIAVLRFVSKKSAKAMQQRNERELEELRRRPVLHLND
jgi:Flp pilus assembly protein TadB